MNIRRNTDEGVPIDARRGLRQNSILDIGWENKLVHTSRIIVTLDEIIKTDAYLEKGAKTFIMISMMCVALASVFTTILTEDLPSPETFMHVIIGFHFYLILCQSLLLIDASQTFLHRKKENLVLRTKPIWDNRRQNFLMYNNKMRENDTSRFAMLLRARKFERRKDTSVIKSHKFAAFCLAYNAEILLIRMGQLGFDPNLYLELEVSNESFRAVDGSISATCSSILYYIIYPFVRFVQALAWVIKRLRSCCSNGQQDDVNNSNEITDYKDLCRKILQPRPQFPEEMIRTEDEIKPKEKFFSNEQHVSLWGKEHLRNVLMSNSTGESEPIPLSAITKQGRFLPLQIEFAIIMSMMAVSIVQLLLGFLDEPWSAKITQVIVTACTFIFITGDLVLAYDSKLQLLSMDAENIELTSQPMDKSKSKVMIYNHRMQENDSATLGIIIRALKATKDPSISLERSHKLALTAIDYTLARLSCRIFESNVSVEAFQSLLVSEEDLHIISQQFSVGYDLVLPTATDVDNGNSVEAEVEVNVSVHPVSDDEEEEFQEEEEEVEEEEEDASVHVAIEHQV
uniref:Uncharacterized protein n=1 Tax=Aplanochytrium stocchinoi TaxID=215587 RepID=A0A7S3V166_9STRA|mmetsp:Transcript_6783/g.8556  ORF Transcript_6783/g.8556 Transcript_6783/m.8556 type:complete len:570 (-) Transcript_6783:841-2550(-)|eukprot:CAMPEP_0204831366 /NCGR_PEP_ID=MMETSP1346-20131115/10514_1 /ASSEMBLY_ACC=CAM_ASM_000771 /TAXON_ID=215587 /ORGANISM="Aplanochytrium stocchinoi, Strain GSBS06" /LENGTH=569 /DNA_ID=CAMNT_0051962375 /DNA_START=132 /DNA_END=1841 /DNA_ORIENTATION=-